MDLILVPSLAFLRQFLYNIYSSAPHFTGHMNLIQYWNIEFNYNGTLAAAKCFLPYETLLVMSDFVVILRNRERMSLSRLPIFH